MCCCSSSACPTSPFTSSELSHDVSELHKIRRSMDLEALKLGKGWSGGLVGEILKAHDDDQDSSRRRELTARRRVGSQGRVCITLLLCCVCVLWNSTHHPTDPFTILEPQNLSIGELSAVGKYLTTVLKALKL